MKKIIPDLVSQYSQKELEILNFCKPHLDIFWAAKIAGIILNCDFRDTVIKIKELEEKLNEPENV